MDLDMLPQEILPNVFKFLHVEDRKNVRLTCRKWNDACNRPEVTISEKFVFRRGHDGAFIEDMGDEIEKCNHLRTDWEFHALHLSDLSHLVWEHCGPHIKSLLLLDCEVDDETIQNIIVYCSNLISFHARSSPTVDEGLFSDHTDDGSFFSDLESYDVDSSSENSLVCGTNMSPTIIVKNPLRTENSTFSQDQEDSQESLYSGDTSFLSEDEDEIYFDYSDSEEDGRHLWSADMLQELIDRNIECKSLISFELFTQYPLSNDVFQALFRIYPCIQTFGHGCTSMNELVENNYFLDSTAEKWVYPPMIQNFTATFPGITTSWTDPKPKFKSFCTLLDLQDGQLNVDCVYQFFSNQTDLEKLELFVCNGKHAVTKVLLLRILKSLPELKELHFHTYCDAAYCDDSFEFSSADFGEFLTLTKQLESLTLIVNCGIKLEVSFNSLLLPSTEYSRLKKLRLGRDMDERINLEIFNRCRTSLKYISLHPVNHVIMQKLSKFQIEVRSLFVGNLRELKSQEDSYSKQKKKGSASNPKKRGNSTKRGRKKTLFCLPRAGNSLQQSSRLISFQSLRNLQHLTIDDVSFDVLFNYDLTTFDFPNLKYFHLKIQKSDCLPKKSKKKNREILIFRKMLDVLSTKSPGIEILRLSESMLGAAEIVNYCKRWKYLRLLGIDNLLFDSGTGLLLKMIIGPNEFSHEEEDILNLCSECQSLRWIANFHLGHAYFYNPFSKSLKRFKHFTVHHHKHNVVEDC